MKFIIDAHLPWRLAEWLNNNGHDAVHTSGLPDGDETEDIYIADFAVAEDRIIVTKDSDFLKLYILKGKPSKLLFITTGNIVNKDLVKLFEANFEVIVRLFNSYNVVEMNNSFVLGHNP